ncbi:MAG: zinc ribbon domain-containing protein [Anaerolineae bacterium]|nr:zinc ribbon domain-containing protein [Anaerolineae bacterium]
MDTSTLSNIALLVVTLLGMYLAAFWLALIIWAFRDHRARSRDGLASLAAALTVAILNLPGLLIYLLLRPKETLAEAYERSLEEEALLQEIEEKPVCPGCRRPVNNDWQVCPHCHTTLKHACIKCGKMLDLAWDVCPYCATPQSTVAAPPPPSNRSRGHARPAYSDSLAAPQSVPDDYSSTGEPLEFIDSDTY